MDTIWIAGAPFRLVEYASEADLEAAIVDLQVPLFGPHRTYLDVKRKIGAKGGLRAIPEGYLLDLSGSRPKLYVAEVELASHDPLRHIAVQILQFSLAFEEEPLAVKAILMAALKAQPEAMRAVERYITLRPEWRGADHLLEHLVTENDFAALVVIDQLPENLENVLEEKFRFVVATMELRRYEDQNGARVHRFEPFLAEVAADIPNSPGSNDMGQPAIDTSDIDTVVVPARSDGFEAVFLKEDRWYAIRLHASMRPQIKYIAVYQVAPISAITHIAPVRDIERWRDSTKFVVNFSQPARAIGPISLVKGGRVRHLQNLRYTTKERLEKAKTLDDVW
jgi:hypothetical protein